MAGELVAAPIKGLTEQEAVDELGRRLERLAKRDTRIVEDMDLFARVPSPYEAKQRADLVALLTDGTPDQLKAAGWRDREQLRVALYATLPKKDWPAAMQAAHERTGMRIRKSKGAKHVNNFHLNMVTIPRPRPPDESDRVVVIDTKETE